MALLSVEKRKAYFEYLGLGEYSKANIEALQKKYLRPKDVDGVYGVDTDRLLRHLRNVKKYTKNFSPEEFKCECGGKYCTGYPSYMKKVELQNLQQIRTTYKKPMTVTCGLRCKDYNAALKGSIINSLHLTGYACDFYMPGVTDTLANRKKAIKYIKKLPNHHYTYGDRINSYGAVVSAPYMGNALHTDTSKPAKKTATTAATAAKAATTTAAKTETKTASGAKIVAQAKKFCWPYKTASSKWKYSTGHATSAYKAALKKWFKRKAKISQTDCGYFVSTCVRAAGLGKSFLALPGSASQSYPKLPTGFKIVLKGKKIPSGFLQPGDIIRYRKNNGHQHTFLYFGNGKIAEAGRGHWFPRIVKDTKKYNSSSVKRTSLQIIRAK